MKALFILKVFLFSTVISILIKFLAPYVTISPSAWLAIAIVSTPTVILGILLWQRFLQFES